MAKRPHHRQRPQYFVLVILLASMLIQPSPVMAADDEIPYAARIPYRIVRGITNVGLSWTEILLRPFGERKTESFGEAMAQGAANTLMRMTAGITDITTFWVPDIQMIEIYPDWQGWPYLFHWS